MLTKPFCLAALMSLLPLLSLAPCAQAAERLTETEARWIGAGMPVVRYARLLHLPVDIVVQPSDEPDASPIAMGIKDGRCKLVLSMRGNPGATALLASVPPDLFSAVAEAVFAHEVGHCWRYVQGEWNALPAGFAEMADDPSDDSKLVSLKRKMRETRREEGYADLVGLAWTRQAHRQHYAAVRSWLERFRMDAAAGEHHDTGVWLRLVHEPSAFGSDDMIFRQAQVLWERGLLESD
jgi:hypothetical protein